MNLKPLNTFIRNFLYLIILQVISKALYADIPDFSDIHPHNSWPPRRPYMPEIRIHIPVLPVRNLHLPDRWHRLSIQTFLQIHPDGHDLSPLPEYHIGHEIRKWHSLPLTDIVHQQVHKKVSISASFFRPHARIPINSFHILSPFIFSSENAYSFRFLIRICKWNEFCYL